MDMSETRPQFPSKAIEAMLETATMTRSKYINSKKLITAWQRRVMGRPYPLDMSESERTTMEFIDYQLSDEEKRACEEWLEPTSQEFLDLVDDVVESGYRLTFTRDKKQGCVVVTLIGKDVAGENHDKGMSTRHATVAIAVVMAIYKHVVIFGQGSWGGSDPTSLYG